MRAIFAAALAIVVGTASPGNAGNDYVGRGIVEKTSGCESTGAGYEFDIRYKPPGIRGYNSDTTFSYYDSSESGNFVLKSNPLTSSFKGVIANYIYAYTGPSKVPVSIRRVSQQPSTLKDTTDFIVLRIEIKGFRDDADCIATIYGGLYYRR